jgi:hypothetical protein
LFLTKHSIYFHDDRNGCFQTTLDPLSPTTWAHKRGFLKSFKTKLIKIFLFGWNMFIMEHFGNLDALSSLTITLAVAKDDESERRESGLVRFQPLNFKLTTEIVYSCRPLSPFTTEIKRAKQMQSPQAPHEISASLRHTRERTAPHPHRSRWPGDGTRVP